MIVSRGIAILSQQQKPHRATTDVVWVTRNSESDIRSHDYVHAFMTQGMEERKNTWTKKRKVRMPHRLSIISSVVAPL